MKFRLSIGGKHYGDMETLKGCFVSIDAAYDRFPDRYTGVLRFRITKGGATAWAVLPGGIWDACCEDYGSFRMYLENVVGWHRWQLS